MVGAEDLEVARLEPVPQRGPVGRVAQGWGADVLGALEAFSGEVIIGEGEVLRAGLGVDRLAPLVGEVYGLQRRRAGDVDDEDRGPRHLGQPDRPVRRLGLDLGRTGQGVEAWGRVAARERLLLELGDHVPVLGVNEHENARLFGELQHLEEVVVLGVQGRALVGHEDLDRRDALLGEAGELGLDVVAQVRYGDVEAVVYDRLAPGLLRPRFERPGESAAGFLQGEVYEHRRTAGRRRLRARGPVVRGDGAPEGHVHVGVGVYEARHDEPARGVDGLGAVRVEVRADGRHLLVLDEHVGPVAALGGYDGASGEE